MTSLPEWKSLALEALAQGKLLVHPTDTIPGLTFDPRSDRGYQNLLTWKRRDPGKAILCLAFDASTAKDLWQPLPSGWDEVLSAAWPGPLSVVWRAAKGVPETLLADDGTVGVRVPLWRPADSWFQDVLKQAGGFLPSTSINRTGEPSATSLADVRQLVGGENEIVMVPFAETAAPKPSTVIRLQDSGKYEVLRAGEPYMLAMLEKLAPGSP